MWQDATSAHRLTKSCGDPIAEFSRSHPLPPSQLEIRAMPNPNQHPFVAETGRPIHPRRKSRLACNVCRARKTGCDGRKPVCTACSLKGWADKCGYPDSVMQPSAALSVLPSSYIDFWLPADPAQELGRY